MSVFVLVLNLRFLGTGLTVMFTRDGTMEADVATGDYVGYRAFEIVVEGLDQA